MIAPHDFMTNLLAEGLEGWNIRSGDRPLDGPLTRPTVAAYTTTVTNKPSVTRGVYATEVTVLVFPAETGKPDQYENDLFTALTDVLGVLGESPAITWSEARRGIFNDRPAYQLTTTVYMTQKLGVE